MLVIYYTFFMTLRQRIAISNGAAVCVPIFIVFGLILWNSFFLKSDGKKYLSSQEILYFFENEISRLRIPENFSSEAQNSDFVPSVFEQTVTELQEMGFHLRIVLNGTEAFSNLSDSEQANGNELLLAFPKESEAFLFDEKKSSAVIYKKIGGTISSYILAVYSPNSDSKAGLILNYLLPVQFLTIGTFVRFLFIAIFIVVLLNFVFTVWIQKSLLEPKEKVSFGKLSIYVPNMQVTVGGKEIYLKNREFELLLFLASHPNQVFSKADLIENVWGMDSAATDSTVTVHINRLREKIEADQEHPQFIKTAWGKGYLFCPK